jgi:hypothetical protein
MSKHYIQGATVRLSTEIRDADRVLVDPTTTILKVENPSGSETTYTDAVKDAVGKYHRDILVPTVGTWYYRWEATGTFQQVDEGDFVVDRSAFF